MLIISYSPLTYKIRGNLSHKIPFSPASLPLMTDIRDRLASSSHFVDFTNIIADIRTRLQTLDKEEEEEEEEDNIGDVDNKGWIKHRGTRLVLNVVLNKF